METPPPPAATEPPPPSLARRVLRRAAGRRPSPAPPPPAPPEPKIENVIFSERLVEYPLFFSHFDLAPGGRVLEFGCVESLLTMQLASLGYKVTGFDFRPYPFEHENFEFIQGDIMEWQPREEFDAAVSISVVEHIGLSAYGDPQAERGDKVAVRKLFESLKPGGRLYLTVPAGRPPQEGGWYRVYDAEALRELVPNIEVLRCFWKPKRYGTWSECAPEQVSGLVYDNYFTALAPVQGVAFIVARK
jgi:SAM-dependent methyltransferase